MTIGREQFAMLDMPDAPEREFIDSFDDSRKFGQVVGSCTTDAILRRGIDTEKVLSIDNGALRIQPLIQPGWGRAGIAYGPFRRQNGLALAVFMLNGHNTSQSEAFRGTLSNRLDRWWRGSETYSRKHRLYQWIRSNRKMRTMRQVRLWLRSSRVAARVLKIDENLALGWFPQEVPSDPVSEGNAFVMHATGPENGELWARVGANAIATIRGVQNLQIYYVIVLREKGAVYYAASIPDTHGLPAYPYLRPVAIDPFSEDSNLYAAIYQSVLGQIGFRLDSRVYGIQAARIPELSSWYGSAHEADRLTGTGRLRDSRAEVGGAWRLYSGEYERGEAGVWPTGTNNFAALDPGAPTGLIHAILEIGPAASAPIHILWRIKDRNNFWSLSFNNDGCRLSIRENGKDFAVATSEQGTLRRGEDNSVQISDDGKTFALHLGGKLLFDSRFTDSRLQSATGVGFHADTADRNLRIRQFEAHPRRVLLPTVLAMGKPWLRKGKRVVVADDFEGSARDLAGKVTSAGNKIWEKTLGTGVIELAGDGSAKIRASAQNPSPGRTAYTIDWDYPEFADVEVCITPPGTGRGQKEHGLSGFIFWQDARNYITINIWVSDKYEGASVSSFFHLDGFENLYDAVWSNVGARIHWGIPCRLRIVFDGVNYIVFVDDEPVLYRALTDVYPDYRRFHINRVGLIANWEWGKDTGSVFNDFVVKN